MSADFLFSYNKRYIIYTQNIIYMYNSNKNNQKKLKKIVGKKVYISTKKFKLVENFVLNL